MTQFTNISRRYDRLLHTDAEKAITTAIRSVEDLPPDPRLTEAVILLLKAKDRVADYVDGVP